MICDGCAGRCKCTEPCDKLEKLLPSMEAGANHRAVDYRQLMAERIAVRHILAWENSTSLSQGQREIINLYYRQNMGQKAIAIKLGITQQAVSDRLRKLHNRLSRLSMQVS
jgi:RNA polymerase sigma factor (sigma-70 family)